MQISALKELLANLKSDERQYNGEEILKREKELAKAYMQEERFWKEKSRVNWLKWGDQNTKFFHSKFQARNRQNKIWRLEDGAGGWCIRTENIGNRAVDYFKELFESSNPSNPSQVMDELTRKVSLARNRNLTRPVTENEIKRAIFSIDPFSALGDDGFSAKFYQNYWGVVKEDVCSAIRSFFQWWKDA